MAVCTLTNPYRITCNGVNGGIQELYIAGAIKGITYHATTSTEILEAWTAPNSEVLTFRTFEQDIEIANAVETVTADRTSGSTYMSQSLTLTIHYSADQAANDELRSTVNELLSGNFLIMVRENSGIYRLWGAFNGLRVSEGEGGPRQAFSDLNGITLTFSGIENEPAPLVTPGVTSPATGTAFTI